MSFEWKLTILFKKKKKKVISINITQYRVHTRMTNIHTYVYTVFGTYLAQNSRKIVPCVRVYAYICIYICIHMRACVVYLFRLFFFFFFSFNLYRKSQIIMQLQKSYAQWFIVIYGIVCLRKYIVYRRTEKKKIVSLADGFEHHFFFFLQWVKILQSAIKKKVINSSVLSFVHMN